MKRNTELRELAWKRLWADRWFGRLFGGGLLLATCGYAARSVVSGILGRFGIQDWGDYQLAVAMNRLDPASPIPKLTEDFVVHATSASALGAFIGYIMSGIAAYGCAVILLRCLKNEENGWLGEAFGGFKDPFGMMWLFVRLLLIYIGWTLVALLPLGLLVGVCFPLVKSWLDAAPMLASIITSFGIVLGLGASLAVYLIPFYRYRFLWLVKAEHPEWRAGECLRSCRRLMDGHKLESFWLDCSYWKPITLVLLLLAGAMVFAVLGPALDAGARLSFGMVVCVGLALPAGLLVMYYVRVGQGLFYRELQAAAATSPSSGSPS